MKISSSSIGANSQSPFKNISKGNGEDTGKSSKNSVIDQLRKQREDVIKQRNALIAKTGEENKPLDSIKEQVKAYNQRIDNINSQIATETAAMAEEAIKDQKTGKSNDHVNTSKPKTEEEANNEKMSMIAKLGHRMESAKNIDSIREQTEGEANVAEQELKLDGGRRDEFIKTVAEINPEAAESLQRRGLSIDSKAEKLSGLRQRILELTRTLGEEVGEIQQEIEDIKLQDKMQNLLGEWNKTEKGELNENESEKNGKDSIKPPVFLEEAFKTASGTATDFLEKHKAWSKEADERKMSGDSKTTFIYDRLNQWEENLKSSSPSEYESWKQLFMSVDVFA